MNGVPFGGEFSLLTAQYRLFPDVAYVLRRTGADEYLVGIAELHILGDESVEGWIIYRREFFVVFLAQSLFEHVFHPFDLTLLKMLGF
ncbi:hypothetical protein ES703_02275 [subsurface metagenome]